MRCVRIVNKSRGSVLGDRVAVADTIWRRVRGFLGRPRPAHGEGLLLSPCRAIHMYGMPYALDVLFLDRHGEVIGSYEDLRPWRRTGYHRRAEYALELPAGTVRATGTSLNDFLAWLPSETLASGGRPRPMGSRIDDVAEASTPTPSDARRERHA
jgi:uncharacterized membrane protein (UPF0127 family)